MRSFTRRKVLCAGAAFAIPPGMATLLSGCNQSGTDPAKQSKSDDAVNHESQESTPSESGAPMKVQYLEIVTPEVDALCLQYSSIYNINFSEPEASFGGARMAKLNDGGMLGIRGPMRDTEAPVVRPYMLVDDIKSAVELAAKAGAEIAMPPMEIPEHGSFAIVVHGGIDCGFWQN